MVAARSPGCDVINVASMTFPLSEIPTGALVIALAIWTRLVLFVALGVLLDRTLIGIALILRASEAIRS